MLTCIALELRARRSLLHASALVVALVICALISSIPLPALSSEAAPVSRERLAYGYLYAPILTAPVLASWLEDPFAPYLLGRRRRLARVRSLWIGGLAVVAILGNTAVALTASAPDAVSATVENSLLVSALLAFLVPLSGTEWASLAVVAYGAMGLFLPPHALLLINREPAVIDALAGTVLLGLAIGLTLRRATPP